MSQVSGWVSSQMVMQLLREGTAGEGTNLGEKMSSAWGILCSKCSASHGVVWGTLGPPRKTYRELSQREPQPPRSADEEGSENLLWLFPPILWYVSPLARRKAGRQLQDPSCDEHHFLLLLSIFILDFTGSSFSGPHVAFCYSDLPPIVQGGETRIFGRVACNGQGTGF